MVQNLSFFLLFLFSRGCLSDLVDGGGYRISSPINGDDLTAADSGDQTAKILGRVTTAPTANSPQQKWGISFYGRDGNLGCGANNYNNVSFELIGGRAVAVNYDFLLVKGIDYKIRSREEKACLTLSPFNIVTLGDCEAPEAVWTFFRNG